MNRRSLLRILLSLAGAALILLLLSGCALQAQVPSTAGVKKDLSTAKHALTTVKKDVSTAKHDTGTATKKVGVLKKVIAKAKTVNKKLHVVRKLLCVFHSYRAIQDIIHHHPGWGALQVYRAARTCRPRK